MTSGNRADRHTKQVNGCPWRDAVAITRHADKAGARHPRCLTGLGGVARRGIYDNRKTAVDHVPGCDNARVVSVKHKALEALAFRAAIKFRSARN
jgi:hypothetical protein